MYVYICNIPLQIQLTKKLQVFATNSDFVDILNLVYFIQYKS